MGNETIALKEWAVAVRAIEEGKQLFVMRKGGIREETRDFRLESGKFYFYPTYEHQKKELLKDGYRQDLEKMSEGWRPDGTVVDVTCFAEAVETLKFMIRHRSTGCGNSIFGRTVSLRKDCIGKGRIRCT